MEGKVEKGDRPQPNEEMFHRPMHVHVCTHTLKSMHIPTRTPHIIYEFRMREYQSLLFTDYHSLYLQANLIRKPDY